MSFCLSSVSILPNGIDNWLYMDLILLGNLYNSAFSESVANYKNEAEQIEIRAR